VDWWSFGVLLYEMTAGFTPFIGETSEQVYEQIVTGQVTRYSFSITRYAGLYKLRFHGR